VLSSGSLLLLPQDKNVLSNAFNFLKQGDIEHLKYYVSVVPPGPGCDCDRLEGQQRGN
jgi:hypothetical protein